MKLTKLLNGTWVDLKTVTRVVPIPASSEAGYSWPDRVVVHYGENVDVIDADNYEHAVKIAEDIAMRANRAVSETPLDMTDKPDTQE